MINDIVNKVILGIILGCVLCIYSICKGLEDKISKLNVSLNSNMKETDYNGIKLGDFVETNQEFGDKVSGNVLEFLYRGEAYPVAILTNDRAISVFWLRKIKSEGEN